MLAEAIYIFSILVLMLYLTILKAPLIVLFILGLLIILVTPTVLSLATAPFVPTTKKKLETMLEFAGKIKGQRVYDLGAGDGRLVSLAGRADADAVGYEISFPLVLFFTIKRFFTREGGMVLWRDFWQEDISDADVIFTFLMPKPMERFKREIYPKLKPGTKIISNSFEIPGLKAVKGSDGVFLYIKRPA